MPVKEAGRIERVGGKNYGHWEILEYEEFFMLLRRMEENEKDILRIFLYEAIFIPEGVKPPDRSIIEQPELRLYYEDFRSLWSGSKK